MDSLDESGCQIGERTFFEDGCEGYIVDEDREHEASQDSFQSICQQKSSRYKVLSMIHCNLQTLTDIKLGEINNETSLDHLHFFTELNIRSDEHLSVIKNDVNWEWVTIKKHENDKVKRRIGMRYHTSLQKDIKVSILSQGYRLQDERTANQADLSVVQYMVFEIKIFHLIYKIMLVYRLDDASSENTDFILDQAAEHNVHFLVGDINIDSENEKSLLCPNV